MIQLSLMLIFCLAIAIFAVQNTVTVQLHFLMWKTQNFSVAVLVIMCVAVGAFLAFLIGLPTHHRRRQLLKQRDRELSELKDAISKH